MSKAMAEQDSNALESVYHVLHDIYDRCEDDGDRIYLGSTNDHHTLKRQLRRIENMIGYWDKVVAEEQSNGY